MDKKNANPFKIIRENYSSEEWERIVRRNESKNRAEIFFVSLYGYEKTQVIIANVFAEYTNTFKRSPQSF